MVKGIVEQLDADYAAINPMTLQSTYKLDLQRTLLEIQIVRFIESPYLV